MLLALGSSRRVLALLPALSLGLGALSQDTLSMETQPAEVATKRSAVDRPIRFGRDIRPILSDRCFFCHGPDEATQEADLRLDSFEEATRDLGGAQAIAPGDAEASLLIERIFSDDPSEIMPPPESGKPALTQEQKELLKAWIEQGAEYEPHWAFVRPELPEVPETEGDDWSRGAIDRFIRAGLDRAGLEPSPEADRATLARRAFLDLTGLPPTVEELDEFLADDSEGSFERLVDRLLTEEPYVTRYAERMATPWLDLARFADTSGIHMDAGRQAWPWRDWVLQAFRDNRPFDEFTIEQLAGDLLPDATIDQRIASGFHRHHVTSDEGGAINAEYLLEYAVDRVETTGAVWLGLTVGCARCHDHKFDPISQEDFYSLIAFFNNVEQPGVYGQSRTNANRALEPKIRLLRPEDEAKLAEFDARIAALEAERDEFTADEIADLERFLTDLNGENGFRFVTPNLLEATSEKGADMTALDDGSILVSGENPSADVHTFDFELPAGQIDTLRLEALTHESLAEDRIGRSTNGNAVLSGVTAELIKASDPEASTPLEFTWAWADIEQPNGDFVAMNALDPKDGREWAAASHQTPGGRTLLFLSDEAQGHDEPQILRVKLHYNSRYAQHVLGRVRIAAARSNEAIRNALPIARGRFVSVGPFETKSGENPYETLRDGEGQKPIRSRAKVGERRYQFDKSVLEAQLKALPARVGTTYFGYEFSAPTAREIELSLGSDDGIQVFLDGEVAFENRTNRGVARDQDRAKLQVSAGAHRLVFRIINTGGPGGFFHEQLPSDDVLPRSSVALLLGDDALRPVAREEGLRELRSRFSPRFRDLSEQIVKTQEEKKAYDEAIPESMVMSERAMPRETFVMKRGVYDAPDKERPVTRELPEIFGSLSEAGFTGGDSLPTRLDLARWIVSDANPLTARVVVNRYWEMLFGTGIVPSSEDFGLQGSWPTHPELLDHLAVTFREGGWDVRDLLRRMMTSATYRQVARRSEAAAETDPSNALLSYFPRQRLSAEQIRDQALYVSGLLVERLGGPSVKPYQPEGLWREVAMVQSNTSRFVRGNGEDLWRRSVYTYWKRAAPPPSMLTFDAPTREFCNVRRDATNTPLQALVLWNDVQFVEAARKLAARVMGVEGDDAARIRFLFRSCTSEDPEPKKIAALNAYLDTFRERYRSDEEAAKQLVMVGDSPVDESLDAVEQAAWTMLANAVMATDATIVKD